MQRQNSPMSSIEIRHFRLLLEQVASLAPELLPTCRWLACGPGMAPLILGDDAAQPSADDLARLAALLEAAPPEAAAGGRALLAAHSDGLAEIDVAVERLVDAATWAHPTEVLGRPCPDLTQLLNACNSRLEKENGDRRHQLETAHLKLERAVRLEAKARQRRDRWR